MSKKWFVYWCDNWPEKDGEGLEEFDKKEDALEFIRGRFNGDLDGWPPRTLLNYQLIHGEKEDIRHYKDVWLCGEETS